MKERPIIMQAESVRAILAGAKTQTRRVATHRHGIWFLGGRGQEDDPSCWGWAFDGPDHSGYMVLARGLNQRHDHGMVSMPCPYGEVGDRLWVKETWQAWRQTSVEYDEWEVETDSERLRWAKIERRATSKSSGPWRSPLYMPRWSSRLTLEVTAVRVQRLQEISEEDARDEGCNGHDPDPAVEGGTIYAWHGRSSSPCPRAHYLTLWDRINGKRAPLSSNPWVWAITFRRLDQ